jgi:hypothetical protein
MKTRRAFVTIAVALSLAACTAGQTTAPPINSVNPLDPNYSKLQFAVGTANLYGTASGLNVVSTLRQPNGESATLVNTPNISGPFAFVNAPVQSVFFTGICCGADPYATIYSQGQSLSETRAGALISSTSQAVHPGTPACDTVAPTAGFFTCPLGIAPNTTTFGQAGGVFAMGLAPYNTVNTTGQSYSYSSYPEPLYNTATHPQFIPWGGPPAFDPNQNGMGTRDGTFPAGFDSFGFPFGLGVGEGITAFSNVTPAVGTYSLNVTIAFLGNNGQPVSGTLTSTARLSSLALLQVVTAPTVVPDTTTGAASMTVTVPAGVTQAYIQIVDYGPGGSGNPPTAVASCHTIAGTTFIVPTYYTLEVTASGSYGLSAGHGPNTSGANPKPSPTICTAAQNSAAVGTAAGDNFTVQMIGFDYPAFQAAHSLIEATTPQAPAIAGASGQSDLTISVPNEEDYPTYTPVALSVAHHPLPQRSLHAATPIRASRDVYRKLGLPMPRL